MMVAHPAATSDEEDVPNRSRRRAGSTRIAARRRSAYLTARIGIGLRESRMEHLRRQQLVVATASGGGWQSRPERPIDRDAYRSRSIDVYLERASRREIAIVEIEDLLADGGDAMRGLGNKVSAVRREVAESGVVVQGLLILRATSRNRALVRELRDLFRARFPASSEAWLAALRDPARPKPNWDGFAWSSVDGSRLFAARLG
jgi:hypothetical protein